MQKRPPAGTACARHELIVRLVAAAREHGRRGDAQPVRAVVHESLDGVRRRRAEGVHAVPREVREARECDEKAVDPVLLRAPLRLHTIGEEHVVRHESVRLAERDPRHLALHRVPVRLFGAGT